MIFCIFFFFYNITNTGNNKRREVKKLNTLHDCCCFLLVLLLLEINLIFNVVLGNRPNTNFIIIIYLFINNIITRKINPHWWCYFNKSSTKTVFSIYY